MTGPRKFTQADADTGVETRQTGGFSASGPAPLRVVSFESRRGDDMRSLIERQGACATVVPSMREVSLEQQTEAFEFAEELFAGRIDVVVFLTGVGTRFLLNALEQRFERAALIQAVENCVVIVRGPKPTAVLREWGIRIDHRAALPNTWREVLDIFEKTLPVSGKTVAIQEYGRTSIELYNELDILGAKVLPVPVYRWDLPEEIAPLVDAVRAVVAGEYDVLMFTSANQINNVLQVAERERLSAEFMRAANQCVIASVGPTCSEALVAAGLGVDVEADPPKMAPLVRVATSRGRELLPMKRGVSQESSPAQGGTAT